MKFNKNYWFSFKIDTKSSQVDNTGFFANENIVKGEVVIRAGGECITYEEKGDFYEGPYSYLEIPDSDQILITKAKVHFGVTKLNHSCCPNVEFLFPEWIANQNISIGSELTCDYSTLGYSRNKGLVIIQNCTCGMKNCRKTIRL